MDIQNTEEIIKNILDRYNFSTIYNDTIYLNDIETSKNYIDVKSAIEFLYSSAIVGNKSLGIFKEVPYFHITTPLRSEFLIITNNLPDYISTPTIIIKKTEDIVKKLLTSIRISSEFKIPVTVVITENVINNYSSSAKVNNDLGRVNAFLSETTFKNLFTKKDVDTIYKSVDELCSTTFPLDEKEAEQYENNLSLNDTDKYFPDYLIPGILPATIVKNLTSYSSYVCLSNENETLVEFFKNNYNYELKTIEEDDELVPDVIEFLCPGDPYVNIFIKHTNKDTVIYTDSNCDAVYKVFPQLTYMTIDGYIGIIANDVKRDTLFIGKASSYKPHYANFLSKRGRMILLNDNNVSKIPGFVSIRHPKKLPTSKNVLFPYSSHNIKSYMKGKIKIKYDCSSYNLNCGLIDKTRCPAIYLTQNGLSIDSNICTGCLACKAYIKSGDNNEF